MSHPYIVGGDRLECFKVDGLGTGRSHVYLLPSHEEEDVVGDDEIDAFFDALHLQIKLTKPLLDQEVNVIIEIFNGHLHGLAIEAELNFCAVSQNSNELFIYV